MSISSVISSNNNQYKKIFSKFSNNNRINVNHLILNKNKSDKNFFDNNYNKNNLKKIIIKKDKVIPFNSTHFNKSISTNIYKAKDNFPKTKKYYIKSPISFFKGVSLPSTQNLNSNKNIPLLSINTNKNTNISQDNPQKTVEYNSINCIINNFNVSCKSIGSHEENKKAEFIKFKKYYDFFCKNNQKIKNHIINLKRNSSMNNNIKNLSNISETNNYNINNISNDNIKTEDLENKQIQERIQKRHQENKKKMIYLKELEKKNQKLKNDYQEIKMKNIEYNKALERLFKFLRVLKNNGMDIQEMMDNISSGEDYDEYLDIDEETEESDDSEEEEQNEVVLSDGSVISNLKQLSTGLLRNHDEFTKGSKLNLKENIIPMLKLYKIKKN
jgi:hypothetical protein